MTQKSNGLCTLMQRIRFSNIVCCVVCADYVQGTHLHMQIEAFVICGERILYRQAAFGLFSRQAAFGLLH